MNQDEEYQEIRKETPQRKPPNVCGNSLAWVGRKSGSYFSPLLLYYFKSFEYPSRKMINVTQKRGCIDHQSSVGAC